MLTYVTYGDYLRTKRMNEAEVAEGGEQTILDYLGRATRIIDGVTHRRFFPHWQQHRYELEMMYVDLRNRLNTLDDLTLRTDLLEAFYVQIDNGVETETGDSLTVTASQTELTVADGAAFAPGDHLRLNKEYLFVEAVSGNTLEVRRGTRGSRIAAHTSQALYQRNMDTLHAGETFDMLGFNIYPKSALRVYWPQTWRGTYNSFGSIHRKPNIFVTAWWGFHDDYEYGAWVNTNEVVPAGGITASVTTINMSDVTGTDGMYRLRMEKGYLLRIDDELLEVVNVTEGTDPAPDTISVLRGQLGTLPAAHVVDTPIYRWQVHADIQEACIAIAKTWRDSDNSVGGRQGVSQMSSGAEIALPEDATKILSRYVRAYIA